MCYGKVDHDRFALPRRARGAAHRGPRAGTATAEPTEAGGWALRVTQIAVVCTYFLASWAKLRFGGIDWMTGSVLARAILRRGTDLADLIAVVPGLLIAGAVRDHGVRAAQPAGLRAAGRGGGTRAVAFFYAFHLVTFATITISFAPHLVAMTSFLPLERVRPIVWARRAVSTTRPRPPDEPAHPVPEPAPPADPHHAAPTGRRRAAAHRRDRAGTPRTPSGTSVTPQVFRRTG